MLKPAVSITTTVLQQAEYKQNVAWIKAAGSGPAKSVMNLRILYEGETFLSSPEWLLASEKKICVT
jgi:hypothetical protein